MLARIVSKDFEGKKIRINQTDCYVCLTDMAKATGKKVNDFLRLDNTRDFIRELSSIAGIPVIELLLTTSGNTGKTIAHPQIAIKFAGWLSAKFEVMMTGWILELLTTGKVELQSAPTPAVVIAIDDSKRMHNAGQSVASRDYQPEMKKSKRSVPNGWLTVGEWLQLIMGDRKAAKDAGVIFWLSRQISDLYRSNTGYEPPKVPCKRGSVYCYPLEYREIIASHYHSWAKTHAEQLVAIQLRLAAIPKQISLFDLPEA
jgi:KilA-N domain